MSLKANYNTTILGISWNKSTDTLELAFTPCIKEYDILIKRKMISTINSLYDVLGWVASIATTGKLIFSDVCNKKLNEHEMNLFYVTLKKDGRIGRNCWNRARTLQYLGMFRHMQEVTSNYTDFLTLPT